MAFMEKCYSVTMTSSSKPSRIIGRYAPSPTGELHLGNLRTALLAWLSVRKQGGEFRLRMEDLDTPRVVKGSADQILKDLEWLGLDWDGPVMYQSSRIEAYEQAMKELGDKGLIYPCFCSRKDIQQSASAPHGKTAVYAGTCRALSDAEREQRTLFKSPAFRVVVSGGLMVDVGDFVIKRADHLFAYQLAVVVDDLAQSVNEVVRGADLISSTARQTYLLKHLSVTGERINYRHAPLMMDNKGQRLSKRDGSASIRQWRNAGGTADELLALLIKSVGVEFDGDTISALELLDVISGSSLRSVFM